MLLGAAGVLVVAAVAIALALTLTGKGTSKAPTAVTADLAPITGIQQHGWSMLELLYQNQGNETQSWLTDSLARRLGARIPGLDVDKLIPDASGNAVASEASRMDQLMQTDGVSATPTFVLTTVDGKRHLLGAGNFPPSTFASTFDRALRAA